MSKVIIKLDNILTYLNITMNKLAVESKIRQGSIIDMTKGDTKAIKLDTLTKILDTLNSISKEQGKREIELTDILEYVTDESNNEAANE